MSRCTGHSCHPLFAPSMFLLLFWVISVWNLGRFPRVHPDEAWILSPGYKLFSQGIYGSDLFTGFHGMDQVYLEFMPLMSVLQGASTKLFGVGVLQIRWLPVTLGMLTLALSFSLARQLAHAPSVGLLTMTLLIFWQWTPAGQPWLVSGVPLVDLARVARYDVLVAPLGLGALCAWVRARTSSRPGFDYLSGFLAGMAGLAHIYGLFWLLALLLLSLIERASLPRRPLVRTAGRILIGAATVWLLWLAIVALNWNDFVGQTAQYRDRFDIGNVAFYLRNVANERHRYLLGWRFTSLFRIGLWLLVAGVPLGLVWLTRQAKQRNQRRARWLLTPSLLIPIMLALLIHIKTFNYLITLVPLFSILLAWGWDHALSASRLSWRVLARVVLMITILQGAWGIGQMQSAARQATDSPAFFTRLRLAVPARGRILGPTQYWLALADRDYRSDILPFLLSSPRLNSAPISLDTALTRVGPDIVLVDGNMADTFNNYGDYLGAAAGADFWGYFRRRHAVLIAELKDNYDQNIQVFQVSR